MPSALLVLRPWVQDPEPYCDAAAALLGSVLICTMGGSLDLAELSCAVLSAPWCPVVIALDRQVSVESLTTLLPLLPRSVALHSIDQGLSADRIRSRLRARVSPTARDIGDYLRARGTPRPIRDAIEDTVAAGDGEPGSVAGGRGSLATPSRLAANRRLAQAGDLRCREWLAIVQLLRILECPPSDSLEQTAWRHDLDPRTLRSWALKFMGQSLQELSGLPGWEWKLEAVLRRYRYLPATPASRHERMAGTLLLTGR